MLEIILFTIIAVGVCVSIVRCRFSLVCDDQLLDFIETLERRNISRRDPSTTDEEPSTHTN